MGVLASLQVIAHRHDLKAAFRLHLLELVFCCLSVRGFVR